MSSICINFAAARTKLLKNSRTVKSTIALALIATAASFSISCSSDDEVPQVVEGQVTTPEKLDGIDGFYVLCQGNMGMNKCTLDRFTYSTGAYRNNVWTEANPELAYGLGDMGNAMHLFDGKLYITVNGSNIVEVVDAATTKHVARIQIPNCRYITDDGHYVYVSSYAGKVGVDPNAQIGYVARINPQAMTVDAECNVGYQPEQMAVAEGKLYVANSGGYRVPEYDHTVSVIDTRTFTVANTIDVAVNLYGIVYDQKHHQLFVSSRGDYYLTPSTISTIDVETDQVTAKYDIPCTEMALNGNRLYLYSSEWSYITNAFENKFAVYDTEHMNLVSDHFISDSTAADIVAPYGIAVNTINGDVLISDARDYINPGYIRCYTADGKLRWKTVTGDIPSQIVFH